MLDMTAKNLWPRIAQPVQVNWGDIHMKLYVKARLNNNPVIKTGGMKTNIQNHTDSHLVEWFPHQNFLQQFCLSLLVFYVACNDIPVRAGG